MMNLIDPIDKSSYSLLFSEETELNPYVTTTGNNNSTGASSSSTNGTSSDASTDTCTTTTSLRNFTSASDSKMMHKPHHTILNMKTTLVNGKYSSCDKFDPSSSDLEADEKRPLVQAEMIHGVSPLKVSNAGNNSNKNVPLPIQLAPTSYKLGNTESDQLQGSYNIEYISTNGSVVESLVDVELYENCVSPAVILPPVIGAKNTKWGPPRPPPGPDIIASNLSSGPTVNTYSEGPKILPPTYFIRDYGDIFGNIVNYDETDNDVAKLPITSEESKMFLIGLSSNNELDEEEEEDEELMENEDQGSSNSPFQSATEEMGGDGDGDRGDQDPLLIRPPPKQNVFHQFIRSAKSSKNSRMKQQRRHSFRESPTPRDQSSSSSSALIKEVRPPEHDGGSSSSQRTPSQDNMRGGGGGRSRCSIGILLAAVSCFFFATSALIVKISTLHPMELLAVRGLVQGILVSPIVISTGNSFLGPSGSRSLLLARAVLGAVALIMGFASIHLIPLADAATVIFTSPVFVSIFACLCLGEVCGWFDVFMIALTLLGVLLVSKPSFSFISTGTWTGIVGTIFGLCAAMLTALAFIILRQLKQVHYSVVVFWFSSVLATFGAVLTIALDGFTLPRTWSTVMECIGIGFCGFFGQILLTKALQSENALPIAVTRTFDIVLAFFYQITLLHDTPDWYSYLGSILVVACVLLTAFRRWYKESLKNRYTRVQKLSDDNDNDDNDNPEDNLQESNPSSPLAPHHHHHHHRGHHRTEEEVSFN